MKPFKAPAPIPYEMIPRYVERVASDFEKWVNEEFAPAASAAAKGNMDA